MRRPLNFLLLLYPLVFSILIIASGLPIPSEGSVIQLSVEKRIVVVGGKETPWWERSVFDRNGDGLADVIDRNSSYPYFLLCLKTPPTSTHIRYIKSMGLKVGEIYGEIETIEVSGPTNRVLSLADKDFVAMIFPPGTPHLTSHIACPNAKVRDSEVYSPNTAWDLGYRGDGISIAVMDTGVDDSHPSLKGKWLGGVDFTKPNTPLTPRDGTYNADDTNGHGTTCSGIAMGTGAPEGKYMGAAPEARLVEVRIGTVIGYAPGELFQDFYDATLKGLQWILEHRDTAWQGAGEKWRGIEVVSISWGIDVGGPSDGTDPYSRMLDRLVERGMVVSNAAGNEGPDNNGFTGLSASSDAIIVAASDDRDTIEREDDLLAWYSSRGPRTDDGDSDPYDELRPDVTAPGTNITQAVYERRGDGSGGGYGPRGSGTSYATPLVAGLTALILEANPDLTPKEVREILRATAERRGDASLPEVDPFWNRHWGWGLVDGGRAVEMALRVRGVKNLNVDLQCFITNTTPVKGKGTLIEGIAWNRYGEIDGVKWRVDRGEWRWIGKNTTGYLRFKVLL
ncbi:MAG: S8 family serine peptidase, partial [Thermoplasmata archaeon]|nr:S8 family serine peptidase [Thermoplasmata archaeon]